MRKKNEKKQRKNEKKRRKEEEKNVSSPGIDPPLRLAQRKAFPLRHPGGVSATFGRATEIFFIILREKEIILLARGKGC